MNVLVKVYFFLFIITSCAVTADVQKISGLSLEKLSLKRGEIDGGWKAGGTWLWVCHGQKNKRNTSNWKMKFCQLTLTRARQTRLPACPGQVKSACGQAVFKCTCPHGQMVILKLKICWTLKCQIIQNLNAYFLIPDEAPQNLKLSNLSKSLLNIRHCLFAPKSRNDVHCIALQYAYTALAYMCCMQLECVCIGCVCV